MMLRASQLTDVHMRERRTPAIIRYNKDADASNWYRAKIMLYYPWYSEEIDLLGGFPTCQNEQNYTREEVENVLVDEDDRPEHAWCQLAPTTNSNTREQGVDEQDLIDNANLLNSSASNVGLSVRFESAANPQVIAPES